MHAGLNLKRQRLGVANARCFRHALTLEKGPPDGERSHHSKIATGRSSALAVSAVVSDCGRAAFADTGTEPFPYCGYRSTGTSVMKVAASQTARSEAVPVTKNLTFIKEGRVQRWGAAKWNVGRAFYALDASGK
jgi:hypothetical protein